MAKLLIASKCHFLTSCQKVKRFGKRFVPEKAFLLKLVYRNFVRNLTSKLARSTFDIAQYN